ncbi:hypothetical protein GGS20DRAFT_520515 [Poronia punctata]|nr:hypothetical protein GGS20DRAFT_520515 [Poronia punctata]
MTKEEENEKSEVKKRPPREKQNPIESAIISWYATLSEQHHNVADLVAQAPKRWTAYGPLVLLPAGAFTSPAWRDVLAGDAGTGKLWRLILDGIAGSSVTHLAINEGIPSHLEGENILRSPGGLRMLYGDFGPAETTQEQGQGQGQGQVTQEEDFSRAFWVSTKQNGIIQTWAPRWTMFSRGNIKEKARLLGFHHHTSQEEVAVAVDLYAGIGYFAFCYASLGFRVFCWELNPWSVEGLRRGAEANGWSVRVVLPRDDDDNDRELMGVLAGSEQIVVFLEDNTRAAERIRVLDKLTREREADAGAGAGGLRMGNIMHVNCGLLPTSEGSWDTAWDIASESPQACFHIHENVGASDIDARKEEIRQYFARRVRHGSRVGTEEKSTRDRGYNMKTITWHSLTPYLEAVLLDLKPVLH